MPLIPHTNEVLAEAGWLMWASTWEEYLALLNYAKLVGFEFREESHLVLKNNSWLALIAPNEVAFVEEFLRIYKGE